MTEPIRSTAWHELDEEAPADAEPGYVEPEDFNAYRKCPVCGAGKGKACRALSGRVVGGRPDGVAVELPLAHTTRPRRTGR